MVLTAKERSAIWRQKLKENPVLYEEYKKKERERNKRRKEKGDQNRKSIKEMSQREQRKKRKEWRTTQRNKRKRDKDLISKLPETPPNSPPLQNQQMDDRRAETMRKLGRKKIKRDRAKAYRTIEKLQVSLFRQKKLVNKWKKKCQRLKNSCKSDIVRKAEETIKKGEAKKALMLYESILQRIQRRYRSSTNQEKRVISSLVFAHNILRRYRIGVFAKRSIGIPLKSNHPRVRCIRKTPRAKKSIHEFLSRDDNSRIKAGVKSTITRKGEKRQIRLLNYDLKTLHAKYLTENFCKVSYSLFCQLKPFHIRKPSDKDRDTCLCRTCQNISLKLERAHIEKVLHSRDVDKILDSLKCSRKSKECMYGECNTCSGKILSTFDQSVHLGKQVEWLSWETKSIERERTQDGNTVSKKVNITSKETNQGSIQVLLDEIHRDLPRVAKHNFNIFHQYSSLKHLRENLSADELIVHIDFSENYNCKYGNEIQSMHFGSSKRQISLHTGVAYTRDNTLSFCSVSDCLQHGPPSIWAHLHPVLKYLRQQTGKTVIHFISDGPTTQYRNKQNFYLLANKIFEFGFNSASWNFLEAGHGKGAADGIGAVVKRSADRFVNEGGDIMGSDDLILALESKGTSVKLVKITEEQVKEIESVLPTTLKPITRTMQIHQIIVPSRGTILHRPLSCFCARPAICQCFKPETFSFPTQREAAHSSSSILQTCEEVAVNTTASTVSKLRHIVEVDESLVSNYCVVKYDGKAYPGLILSVVDESLVSNYCVVKYDGKAYPGLILSVDEEEEIEVKTMHRVGRNRFFWPMMDDVLWYQKENIITILDNPPRPVTKRHVEIEPEIWELVEKEEDE